MRWQLGLDEIEAARAQLADSGLVLPPIPEELRPAFRNFGEWAWGTRELDRLEMYMFRHFANEHLENRGTQTLVIPTDYMAMSHGGHGINSYCLTYHLVCRPLAVFFQIGWGGGYMDNSAQASIFNRHCELVTRLVEAALTSHRSGRTLAKVGVVECCPSRGITRFTILDAPTFDLQSRASVQEVGEESDEALAVYAQGISWLKSKSPNPPDSP